MAKERTVVFDECKPVLTEQEVFEAARSGALVVSFDAFPLTHDDGTVAMLGVKLVLADGAVKTVLLDQYACSLLCGIAGKLDEGKWMVRFSTPPGQGQH